MMVCVDEMDTAYLDNLDEYVNDEGRIVTYKWLSLTLGVHSNVAKQMLHHFVTQQRGDGDGGGGLTLTYLLTGVVEESDGGLRKVVKVVREAEVEAARAAINTVSSLHVYSVQKSALPDIGLLYGADYDVSKQHLTSTSRYSGIRCSEAQVSPSTSRLQHLVKEEVPTPLHKSVSKTNEKKEDKKHDAKLDSITTTTTSTTTVTSTTTGTISAAAKPTSQIASMFARQTKKLESCPSTAVKEEKAPTKAKSVGISAFFTKGPAQRKPDTSKLGSPTSGSKSDNTPCPNESKESLSTENAQPNLKGKEDSLVFGVEQEEDKEEVKGGGAGVGNTKTAKSKTSSSSSASKKRKSKGKNDEPKTKRTRIIQLSDSESDEEEERDEEDERLLLLPSPPPVRVNSDSEEEREKNLQPSKCPEEEVKLGMRKKIVDETFTNEAGYLVTKKVVKFVPLTDEEIKQEEEERKKKEQERRMKEEEEKKKSSPTVKSETSPSSGQRKKGGKEDNKKQAKIMSFFTKK